MAQKVWIYHNELDQPYSVTLYHGDKSGHVMIYTQEVFVTIDFSIKDDKSYSFFLGNELFTLAIKYRNSTPQYSLTRDHDQEEIEEGVKKRSYPLEDILKAIAFILVILWFVFFVLNSTMS
jgi:hypothetical protein